MTAVLDANHLAILINETKSSSILRLSDGKLYPLVEDQIVLGGHGNRVVLSSRTSGETYAAEIELPKAEEGKGAKPKN